MMDTDSAAAAVRRLRMMMLIRRFEERAVHEYSRPGQLIGGFCHVASGQEAIPVGVAEIFRRRVDTYVGTYRGHGWALALGMSARAGVAELFGRATGCSGGRGGSMHFFDRANGNMGGWYVVGGQVPLGAGAGFAAKYRGTGGVCFAVMGDGALGQGVVAETLNLASLMKLPVVFIVENNGLACGTQVERHSAERDLVKRGEGFAMPCRSFDGNDVEVVIEEVGRAADRARAGEGPSFLVANTYRFRGFMMSDPMKYRTQEEAKAAKLRDPILIYERRLMEGGVIDPEVLERLEEMVELEIREAYEVAYDDPHPDPDSRFDYVLAETYPFRR